VNLKELTEEINSALDYNPDLESYKSQVARVVNRHYLQLSSQYNWLFRQKTSKLTLRADITGNGTTNRISVGNATTTFDASNVLQFVGTADTLPTPEMLGNTLVINDNDTFTTRIGMSHGASEREFTITGIYDLPDLHVDYGALTSRYGGTGGEEWPEGYQPSDFSGIVLDRPILDPSTASGTALTTKAYYNDWKIEFRQYYLPADCIEVLGMVDRGLKLPVHSQASDAISTTVNTAPNRGRIVFLDSAKEEHLSLDRDSGGDPVVAIEGMPVHISAPMVPPMISRINPRNPDGGDADKHASLIAGDTYEYCYTFVYAGLESPPSPVTRVKFPLKDENATVGYWRVTLASEGVEGDFRREGTFGRTETDVINRGTDVLLTDGPDADSDTSIDETLFDVDTRLRLTGRVKRFYRRKVMENNDVTVANMVNLDTSSSTSAETIKILNMWQGHQRWLHIGDHFTDGVVIDIGKKQEEFADAGDDRIGFPDEISIGTPILGFPQSQFLEHGIWTYHDGELSKVKVLDESGPRQTIKVYRPPSEDMNVEIRYLSRPKRLVADADTPEWPVQYHHLLVYMSLADICLQHGMTTQAQLYKGKSIELMDRMKQKYLSRTNRKYVRRGFDKAVFVGERFGVPTKV
jgi:hypothetical protein